MRRQVNAVAALTVSLALAALGCGDPRTAVVYGVPRIAMNAPGTGPSTDATDVAFGATLLNTQVDRELVVRNEGRVPFVLESVRPSADISVAFHYPSGPIEVKPNELVSFPVSFLPTTAGEHGGTITLVFEKARPGERVVALHGTGVDGSCEASTTRLDFGSTAVGSSYPRQVSLFNHSALAWEVNVLPLDAHGSAAAFEFGAGFAPGPQMVPAATADKPGELIIPIEFRPVHVGEYSAALDLESTLCPSSIALHGISLEHLLECAPTVQVGGLDVCRVDFGFVSPHAKATAQVQFTNLGSSDMNLMLTTLVQPPLAGDAPFAIETTDRTFVVPAGGSIDVDLSFTPTELSEQVGRLSFVSDDRAGYVELVGVGGGPRIDVQPALVDFGKVGVDSFQVRRVTISNVGTNVPGTQLDNLLLAAKDGDTWTEKQAAIVGADAADFSLEWPPATYTSDGLGENQNADLRVHFAPKAEGRKSATLIIYSNDPSTPELQVPVSGLALKLPPCDFDVQPPALNFGTLESNKYLVLPFFFRNRDVDPTRECLVSLLDLTPATKASGAFALVNGPVESATVPGGQSLEVQVRFQPRADGLHTGEVEFYVSSPTRPNVKVPLTGVAQPACIMITPRPLDFGTIGINCSSRQRLFTMYNTCSNSLTVTSIVLQQTVKPNPTDPDEFTVTKSVALPLTIAAGGSSEFGITYHPRDEGVDAATVSVTVAGIPNPSIVPLEGNGSTIAVQTDVFSQGDKPKVDVLLVIDDSCSMDDSQTSMAQNFSSFIHYAVQQKVDYRIAATTVSLESSYAHGRFVPLTGSSPRIITPSTPNKEQVFTQNVHLGTGGTASESLIRPGYLALTNPLINGHNAGFYRDEAQLAIVVVSDAADQDPNSTPVSFYENFFVNLKGVKRRNEFTFSGIIPTLAQAPGGGCGYDAFDAGQDLRVKTLIQNTAGVIDEICNPNWSKALERLGTKIFGLRTTFFLSNTPDMTQADPLVVMIDGDAFPQYGVHGTKRWDYDSGNNALVFETLAAPDPGSTLSVAYHVACL